MEIQHEHLVTKGEFFIRDEQQRKIAVLTYTMNGDHAMVINHTIVEEELEGKGIGKQLVEAAMQFARKQGYKIIPECPFANAYFHKHPETKDILA